MPTTVRSCRIALPGCPSTSPSSARTRASEAAGSRQTNAFLEGAEALGRTPTLLYDPHPGLGDAQLTWRRVEALRQLRAARRLAPEARDARSLWVVATLAQHGGAAPRTGRPYACWLGTTIDSEWQGRAPGSVAGAARRSPAPASAACARSSAACSTARRGSTRRARPAARRSRRRPASTRERSRSCRSRSTPTASRPRPTRRGRHGSTRRSSASSAAPTTRARTRRCCCAPSPSSASGCRRRACG